MSEIPKLDGEQMTRALLVAGARSAYPQMYDRDEVLVARAFLAERARADALTADAAQAAHTAAHEAERAKAAEERAAKAEAKVKALAEFARQCRDGYDCDPDAHRYRTPGRACDSGEGAGEGLAMTPPCAPNVCAKHRLAPDSPGCGTFEDDEVANTEHVASLCADHDPWARIASALAADLRATRAELAALRASLGRGATEYGHEG